MKVFQRLELSGSRFAYYRHGIRFQRPACNEEGVKLSYSSTGDSFSGFWTYKGGNTKKTKIYVEYDDFGNIKKLGPLYYKDGCTFYGDFTANNSDPLKGTKYYEKSSGVIRYNGTFRYNGKRLKGGKGKFVYTDGGVYIGEWIWNGFFCLFHGSGIMKEPKGKAYKEFNGNWKNDKRHGQGTLCYTDGSIYTGKWKDNKRHGQGKLIDKDGHIFEGTWHEDVLRKTAKKKRSKTIPDDEGFRFVMDYFPGYNTPTNKDTMMNEGNQQVLKWLLYRHKRCRISLDMFAACPWIREKWGQPGFSLEAPHQSSMDTVDSRFSALPTPFKRKALGEYLVEKARRKFEKAEKEFQEAKEKLASSTW